MRRERADAVRDGTFDDRDADEVLGAFADPTFVFFDALNVAAWGRRPMEAVGYLG